MVWLNEFFFDEQRYHSEMFEVREIVCQLLREVSGTDFKQRQRQIVRALQKHQKNQVFCVTAGWSVKAICDHITIYQFTSQQVLLTVCFTVIREDFMKYTKDTERLTYIQSRNRFVDLVGLLELAAHCPMHCPLSHPSSLRQYRAQLLMNDRGNLPHELLGRGPAPCRSSTAH